MPITPGRDRGVAIANQSIYDRSKTQKHTIGTRLQIGERVFYYGKVLTTTLRGQLLGPDASIAGPWLIANEAACIAITAANRKLGDTSKAITAALAVGDRGIGVTDATWCTSAVTAGMLKDGYIFLNDSASTVSQYYDIKDNTAGGTIGTDTNSVELLLYDEVRAVTVNASCSVTIMPNPFMNLQLADVDVDECPSGAAMAPGNTTYPYIWVQTWGPGVAMATGANTGGHSVIMDSTPGRVIIQSSSYQSVVGVGIGEAENTGDYIPVNWRIYP